MTEKQPGRPRALTKTLKQEICERIALGETLREICRDDHMPVRSVVFKERQRDPEFADQYALAREIMLEGMEDEILEIADDASNDWMERRDPNGTVVGWQANHDHLHRSKVRVDARKWVMSKRLPRIYGDKIEQTIQGPDGDALAIPVVRVRSSEPSRE